LKTHAASLGLGKLKVLHSLSYLLGIGLPGMLVFGSWLTMNSLDEMKPVMSVSFVFVLLGFFFEAWYSDFRFMDCPSCGDFIQVRFDWECVHCGCRQGEQRLLVDPCRHCGGKMDKISCPECDEVMSL
jgi:hypothetical protein